MKFLRERDMAKSLDEFKNGCMPMCGWRFNASDVLVHLRAFTEVVNKCNQFTAS